MNAPKIQENVDTRTDIGPDPIAEYLHLWNAGPVPLDAFQERLAGVTLGQIVGLVRIDQRERWRKGERIPIESYLQLPIIGEGGEELALDLVLCEVMLRDSLQEKADVSEYVRRFPQFARRLPALFEVNRALEGSTLSVGASGGRAGESEGFPARIGKYKIIAPLDSGGQASVFRAVHPALGKDVVIKLSHVSSDVSSMSERFLAEGRILAEVEHPNLARIYDLDFHGGRAFIVMEFIRGRTLDQLGRQERVTPRRAAGLVAACARALAVMHERGIAHLDLKPKNILLDDAGQPRVIDFGLARWQHAWGEDDRQPGSVSGTVAYMPPEQARGETDGLGPACDIFALGGVVYFFLTGKPLYGDRDIMDGVDRARDCAWDRTALASIPRGLRAVCAKALDPDPARRFTAAGLAEVLDGWIRRPRVLARWIAGAALLALAIILAIVFWPAGTQNPPPAPPVPPDSKNAEINVKPMTIRVYRNKRWFDLIHVLPLVNEDEVHIAAEMPEKMHAALFLFSSDGKLERLREWAPQAATAPMRFPEQEGKSVPLVGTPGTELLLACARRGNPVTLDDLKAAWPDPAPLPALTGPSLFRLGPKGVQVLQRDRGLGVPKDRADPEMLVQRRLEAIHAAAAKHFDYVHGLAFAHRAPSDDE